jgi:hypothetical protein
VAASFVGLPSDLHEDDGAQSTSLLRKKRISVNKTLSVVIDSAHGLGSGVAVFCNIPSLNTITFP